MKNIKLIVASMALMILFGFGSNIYAEHNIGESYEKQKINSIKFQKQDNSNDLSKEAKEDLDRLNNIQLLKLKTDSNYEIALAYSNGDYTFLDTANSLDEAINKANEVKSKVKSDAIPAVVNKEGIVVYATEAIGRIIKIVDNKPSYSLGNVTNIYKTATTKDECAQIAHEFVDDVPMIESSGNRVKIQVNGFIGYMDIETNEGSKKVTNIQAIPMNQVKNLSYYQKASGGSLNHYISKDVTTVGKSDPIQIGLAPSMLEVNKPYYSYDCVYFYENIHDLVSDLRNNSKDKAINKNQPYYNYYTSLPVRYKSSYSVEEINNYITSNTVPDSVLRNKGKAIVDAQNKHGISANIILSIAMNESAKGTSSAAKQMNNIFGMTKEGSSEYAKFSSIEACIEEFAYKFMHNGFLNPKSWKYNGSNLGNKNFGVNVRYATDPFWGEKAAVYLYDMDKKISGTKPLIEYNRYSIGKIKNTDKITKSSGEVLYDIIANRKGVYSTGPAHGQVGDMIIALSEKNGKYEMYPDRQAPVNVFYDTPYNFGITGFINKSSVDIINTKSNNLRDFTNVTASNLNITSTKTTGKAPYETTIKVLINGKQVGKIDSLATNETYSINIPKQKPNTTVDVEFSKPGYKNYKISKKVNNIFDTFSVDSITSQSAKLTGKGVVGSTVKAYVGNTQIGKDATVDSKGNYNIAIRAQKANTSVVVKMSKTGYEEKQKATKVIGVATGANKILTNDIFKYDAGKGKHLTYINGKGYSQYVYLNKSEKYAFTPSSWMVEAGLSVSMPSSANRYTMTVDNNYIDMDKEAKALLDSIKSGRFSKSEIKNELASLEAKANRISNIEAQINDIENINIDDSNLTRALPKKTLTKDIFRNEVAKGKYLTYINGRAYSQLSYLNTKGTYAFTPSSWMVEAKLTVSMPTKSNGYVMKINNPSLINFNKTIIEIKSYL